MKPEVSKIFDDLDAWLDHCRFNLLNYNPADLYKSREYREFARPAYYERKPKGEYNRSGNNNRNNNTRRYNNDNFSRRS